APGARPAGLARDGSLPAAVGTEKGVALGVEAGQLGGAGEVGEVVAALPVFRLVVDDAVRHLDLAGRVVALEVGSVVPCVPQAELDGTEEGQIGPLGSLVGQPRPP